MRVALSCRYPHVEVLVSRTTTIYDLIDKLTQYWQLSNHAQSVSFVVNASYQIFEIVMDENYFKYKTFKD